MTLGVVLINLTRIRVKDDNNINHKKTIQIKVM